MAKCYTWIALLLLAIYCGDRTLGYVCERLFLKSTYRYSRLFDARLPCDILVIGNSRGIHSFYRPAIQNVTGREVANISSNGMPAEVFPIAFNCYLERHAPPDMLLIEVSSIAKQPEAGSLERFLPMCHYDDSLSELMRVNSPRYYFASQVSHLFRYNSELFLRSQCFHATHDQDWVMRKSMSAVKSPSLQQPPEKPSMRNLKALRKTLELAKRENINVRLVLAPFFNQDVAQQWSTWAGELSLAVDHPVIDCSALVQDISCFADHIHLNETGSIKLIDELGSRGVFEF